MGGFANNTTGVSGKKAYDFYEELNSRLPDDFEMKHTAERLLLQQELYQKVEGVGHKNPLLLNVPNIESELNDVNKEWQIKKMFVFSGYVAPGRHTILIKRRCESENFDDADFMMKNLMVYPNEDDSIPPILHSRCISEE